MSSTAILVIGTFAAVLCLVFLFVTIEELQRSARRNKRNSKERSSQHRI